MKVRCLLVDNDPLAISALKKHLAHFEHFEVVFVCNNAVDAFNFIRENSIDLVFVDIYTPMVNGLEFIKNIHNPPLIIITSSDEDYAVQGFELGVIDYLIKPISLKRLVKSLHKISRTLNMVNKLPYTSSLEDHIFIKVDKKMIKIYFEDILYIKSLKDYVIIKTDHKDYVTHYNLSAITRLLPEYLFIRIHRSYTIAINKIKAIDKNCIEIDDKSLPMGRNYIKKVKGKIINGVTV
ncbi:DNA-binding LytR/AlgR family response regulator [Aquimarina sp. EL_43]|uniref:LytR/AlgR family response regulator transcription factor n=1 Tax=unclassified Aquimarina TaxID=2627091 RepID=UPI0018C9D319|nr:MULTISPECIES: LytTR family DNA-binding domain-containing protein [unclassified Aquimarina]MBG6129047.1 DNA-binding LytR/AlgR family response regulator [Aquimarina sp. EL_35]MBG6150111.1 DNA-binding LytR/AlgR family response regulator [Aquimarina sp. EL_32]MBG6167203.1 DNA-binding LytR/AlgR family response regulator [Aquimarina sp. EL_43]